MNGEMLRQLRKIAESEEPVPQKLANQLMVSGMVQVTHDLQALKSVLDEHEKEQRAQMSSIEDKLDTLLDRTEGIQKNRSDIDKLKSNYLVRIGQFIEKHPKTFIMMMLALLVTINMWFVSDFRKAFLEALTGYSDILKLFGL